MLPKRGGVLGRRRSQVLRHPAQPTDLAAATPASLNLPFTLASPRSSGCRPSGRQTSRRRRRRGAGGGAAERAPVLPPLLPLPLKQLGRGGVGEGERVLL
eukprot:66644-Chlamydomonas_euryale.AAC.3